MEPIRSVTMRERTKAAKDAATLGLPAVEPFSNIPLSEPAKRVAIVQSNYVPWIGYFDLIASVDEFIFYDDVQYTSRDWRNRNRIKTPQGAQWLTIPLTGNRRGRICDMTILDPACGQKHWKILAANYRRARCFDSTSRWLQPLFEEEWTSISRLNHRLIEAVCRVMNITTTLTHSSDYGAAGNRNGRLIELCRQAGAGVYVSGPRAAGYVDSEAFTRGGLQIDWMRYGHYPPYRQLWGDFVPNLSILDILFNCGVETAAAMISRRT